ncbi:MAG: hypothetical protein ACOH2A_04490 [Sphingobacteriaceae bacterium]
MYHPFSIKETIKTAWDITKKNFLTIIVYSAIVAVLLVIVQFVNLFMVATDKLGMKVTLFFLLMIIQAYATLGLYKLIFTLIDSEYYEFEFYQLMPTLKMVFSFIVISLLLAVTVVTFSFAANLSLKNYPVVLQIVQVMGVIMMLYVLLRCMFCACFVVDDDSGPLESLGQSFRLTQNNLVKILLILLILLALIAVGFLTLGIGMILTFPLVNVILVVTYRKLIYSNQDVDDDIAETY